MKQTVQAVCEFCGEPHARLTESALEFPYGIGEDQVLLTAVVPVWKCSACDEVYTADGAERRQNEAIAGYLGRMRPSEIRSLRERAGLKQREFAEAIGVGEASIKRWEGGVIVPSKAMNRLLIEYERELDAQEGPSGGHKRASRWRTQRPYQRKEASLAFVLDLAA